MTDLHRRIATEAFGESSREALEAVDAVLVALEKNAHLLIETNVRTFWLASGSWESAMHAALVAAIREARGK